MAAVACVLPVLLSSFLVPLWDRIDRGRRWEWLLIGDIVAIAIVAGIVWSFAAVIAWGGRC